MYKLILNKAIAQKQLKQYTDAIKSLHELDNVALDDTHYFNVKTLEANCYKELKLFDTSLSIYFELYNAKYCKDSTKHLTVLCNIIDAYISMNDTDKLKGFLNEAMNLLKQPSLEIDTRYLLPIYYEIGHYTVHLRQYDDAIIVLTKNLNEARKNRLYNFMFYCLNNLFSIYALEKDYGKLEHLKLYIMELLKNENKAEYHNLLYKYINMYSMMNKKDAIDSLVSFALNLNKKSKQTKKNCYINY